MRASAAVEQLENRSQSALQFSEPFTRIASDQFIDRRWIGPAWRRIFFQLPPRSGERQPLDEQQLLDLLTCSTSSLR